MEKNILAAFRPVKFECGKVHMPGGFTAKLSAMKSKTIEDAIGIAETFVKMSSSEAWLVFQPGGPLVKTGAQSTAPRYWETYEIV